MIDFLPVDHESKKYTELQDMLMSNGDIKIVSMTVTEGGYFLDDGKFNVNHPMIQHDIQNPEEPHTVSESSRVL